MALASQALSFNYVLIQPIGGKPVDLTSSLEHIEYFENIMSPTISMNMKINSGSNLVGELPIRGGEMISLELQTLAGTMKFGKVSKEEGIEPGSGELYVYSVKNLNQPSQTQSFTIHITSPEYFANETSRCMKKYKSATIDNHVEDILLNDMKIKQDRIGIIEKSQNPYAFIGNIKKPFHTIEWLCPKAISGVGTNSKQGVKGKGQRAEAVGTAGYLFYENKDGFNFRSIEGLVSRTRDYDGSSDPKQKGTDIHGPYVYGGKGSIGNVYKIEENYKINFFNVDRGSDIRKSLAVGQFANSTIFFDSLSHEVSVYDYRLQEQIGKKLGKEDETEHSLKSLNSRLFVRISDHGTLGIGTDGFQTSGRDEADQAKSISRYNALFSQSLNIQVPCNTNLKVGDIINCVFPNLRQGQTNSLDESASGNYLIARLNHHIQVNACFTSLNLIRDSYGYAQITPTKASDAAVEGGYTISKKNIKDTGMLVRADNAQYGNSFPKGSFNISK